MVKRYLLLITRSYDIEEGILNLDEEEKIYEYRKRGAYFRVRDYLWWDLELPTEKEMKIKKSRVKNGKYHGLKLQNITG